ncbi:NmrA family NAD(P)-binding protein [Saccharothrix deserti]|uniref:NmrA family NAD(P)-binding protein n=1 Tax=Saccharothrix deserti TaxID=2593674 RepID=UPI00131CE500|nr:NmrA family NAD(P)-binding protein [Saccharothrix deserti]
MAEKKVIAVVGATGAQGGGLARAILTDADGGFAVRALTRNPDSDAARKLAARDLDVVRELNPRLQTFQRWLSENKDGFANV